MNPIGSFCFRSMTVLVIVHLLVLRSICLNSAGVDVFKRKRNDIRFRRVERNDRVAAVIVTTTQKPPGTSNDNKPTLQRRHHSTNRLALINGNQRTGDSATASTRSNCQLQNCFAFMAHDCFIISNTGSSTCPTVSTTNSVISHRPHR